MLYLLGIVAFGALSTQFYRRFSKAGEQSRNGLIASGIAGAAAGLLVAWVVQVGVGHALNTIGTILVLLVIAFTVIPVVIIGVLVARKANDVRISSKLRWARKHPNVSGLRSSDDDI